MVDMIRAGTEYFERGQYEEALKIYLQVFHMKTSSKPYVALFYLVPVYRLLKREEEASELLKQLIDE